MRTLLCITALLVLGAYGAGAQVQEKKLLDRLLQPDMSLQNAAQNKQFTAVGSTTTKQVPLKSFYVSERSPEKEFTAERKYFTPTFDLRKRHFDTAQANLTMRAIPKIQTPYSTSSYRDVKSAPGTDGIVEASTFPGSRPFLAKGKSQKALSAQDQPLSIDQVRELLNKNK